MISAQQATYLIDLPKKMVENDIVMNAKLVIPEIPFLYRLSLVSEADDEFTFLLDVTQSQKNALKFTLHLQEDEAHYGLLRVDYSGRHKNPEVLTEKVPSDFEPFVGQWLETPGHIHYVVDGYKPLAWAIPLEKDAFPVKEIRSFEHITTAFLAFCRRINIETKISIHQQGELFI